MDRLFVPCVDQMLIVPCLVDQCQNVSLVLGQDGFEPGKLDGIDPFARYRGEAALRPTSPKAQRRELRVRSDEDITEESHLSDSSRMIGRIMAPIAQSHTSSSPIQLMRVYLLATRLARRW